MASRRELEDEVRRLERELRRRDEVAAQAHHCALSLDSCGRDLMGRLSSNHSRTAAVVKTVLERDMQPEVARLLELLG